MSDVVLATQQVLATGIVVSYTAIATANTYQVRNDGHTILHVLNAQAGAPVTVTIVTHGKVGGLAIADRTVVIPQATEEFIGPFDRNVYNEGLDDIDVSFSAETTVTAAAIHI